MSVTVLRDQATLSTFDTEFSKVMLTPMLDIFNTIFIFFVYTLC
jgi:hypothetical protein